MGMVTCGQLKEFVLSFVKYMRETVSQYPNVEHTFPIYMWSPYRIVCVISKKNGVAIEFMEKSKDWEISIRKTDKRIEEYLSKLPCNNDRAFFEINGEFNRIESVNLVTRDFYEAFKDIIDCLCRSTTFVMEKPCLFVRLKAGSVKLVNVGIAYVKNGRRIVKKIEFLWLIGTNAKEYFTKEMAIQHAKLEIRRYLDGLIPRIPITVLVSALQEFEKLIHEEDTDEPDMQEFLEAHPFFLLMGYESVESKPKLSEDLIPDFIIKAPAGEYIIVELESPKKKLFTRGKFMPEHKDLKDAKAQMEGYLNYIKNNIEHLRSSGKYPDIKAEKVHGLLIIGLSDDLTPEERDRLKQLNAELKNYKIRTYDELARELKQFLENLGVKYGSFA